MKKKIYKGIEIDLEPRKMKNVRIVYSQGRFILRYPKRLSGKDLDLYLERWDAWILEQHAQHPPHCFDEGDQFLLYGRKYPLERKIAKKSFCQLGDKLYLFGPEDMSLERRKKLIEDFFREKLKERIKEHLPQLEKRTNSGFKEIKVKKMKNWARCQTKTCKLSLSVKSIALDDELFRVLLLHELVHLTIPNHSVEFYEKMEFFWPGSKEINKRIRNHAGY